MRFSISLPQHVADGEFHPDELRGFVSRAEELGFAGLWVMEQTLGTLPTLSPLELLSYAAACTQRLRLGCAVLVTPLHNPVHLAKHIATIDQLSRGRLDVGIGIGGRNRQFSAFGVDPEAGLVARFEEGTRLMKALWTQPKVDFEGRFWQLTSAAMEPKPYQKPHPPLWYGGSAPSALRRAARDGDAFIGAGSSTTVSFAEQVSRLRAELANNGRAGDDFTVAKRVYLTVDDDAGRARKRMNEALIGVYGRDFGARLAPVAVAGTPRDCVGSLREVIDAGAEMLVLNPLFDTAEQMERLAAEVLPELLGSP
jgi:probable F420-dependent oxidoreductase